MRNGAGIGLLAVGLLLSGCNIDPPHDNPVDPDSPTYQPSGGLRFSVLTLNRLPIAGATAVISAAGRFAVTDSTGVAIFDELPAGSYWARAVRGNGSAVIYAADSIRVTIKAYSQTDSSIRLDALPGFSATTVSSATEALTDREKIYKIKMRAAVSDPDGQADLSHVEWKLLDIAGDTMRYQPDSTLWLAELPGDSLPTGRLEDVLGLPLYFEASDNAGNSARSEDNYLWRIINSTPTIERDTPPSQQPVIIKVWFSWNGFFPDTSHFRYVIRINTNDTPPVIRYEDSVRSEDFPLTYTVQDSLAPNNLYSIEVFVVDNFGNYSRSVRTPLEVTAPSMQ